jgi:hypothetical protein
MYFRTKFLFFNGLPWESHLFCDPTVPSMTLSESQTDKFWQSISSPHSLPNRPSEAQSGPTIPFWNVCLSRFLHPFDRTLMLPERFIAEAQGTP